MNIYVYKHSGRVPGVLLSPLHWKNPDSRVGTDGESSVCGSLSLLSTYPLWSERHKDSSTGDMFLSYIWG